MNESWSIQPVAHMRSDFPEKFGIPRQSGLVQQLRSRVVFAPEFRDVNALRGLEAFSHLWLIWGFSGAVDGGWSPTVRPPRLGGDARMGVFATRSPFRPNHLGLSCVRLVQVHLHTPDGRGLRRLYDPEPGLYPAGQSAGAFAPPTAARDGPGAGRGAGPGPPAAVSERSNPQLWAVVCRLAGALPCGRRCVDGRLVGKTTLTQRSKRLVPAFFILPLTCVVGIGLIVWLSHHLEKK